jgi:hypothetical protein
VAASKIALSRGDNLSGPREKRTCLLKSLGFFVSTIDEQGGQVLKAIEPVHIGGCTSKLLQFNVEVSLHLLALPMAPNEGFVRLDKGIGRHNELCIARLAQAQDVLAAHVLLLEQGKLEHEVRLNIDVHVATSYSIRPF